MSRCHFGTDGVRGVVGEFLTLELVERLGRAATLWGGAERVFVGRDTRGVGCGARGGVRARRRLGGRDRGARRRPADARRRAACARPRRRHLGLPQPAGVQRRQVLRPRTGASCTTRGGGDRGAARRAARRRRGHDRGGRGARASATSRRRRALRLRPRRASGSRSTAPTARTRGSRRTRFEQLGAEVHAIGNEPDGTNINVGCGATDLTALQADGQRGWLRSRDRLRRRRRPDSRGRRARRAGRRGRDRRDPRARPRRRPRRGDPDDEPRLPRADEGSTASA